MDSTDVAIIGAGPYGLSVAAHLQARKVNYRQFGIPMRLWRSAMPSGMFLKSHGFASNLSDPGGKYTLEAFCRATGRDYAHCDRPVPLDDFVAYGQWFQSELGLHVDEHHVSDIAECAGGFELTVGDGLVRARKVVVAIGVESFAYTPGTFADLPQELCTHSSKHTDPAALAGREVIIVGAGSSALELAALMHENAVSVQILAREPAQWGGQAVCPPRPVLERLRVPVSGLGPGWRLWFYANLPGMFRRLPADVRVYRARSELGPLGAPWLRDRVEAKVPVLSGHVVTGAKAIDKRVRLSVRSKAGQEDLEFETDHVIAATGYRASLHRLTFLSEALRSKVVTTGETPSVGRGFSSSVPGLFFIGPLVAPSLGPLMRFVCGADYAARMVAPRLAARGLSAA